MVWSQKPQKNNSNFGYIELTEAVRTANKIFKVNLKLNGWIPFCSLFLEYRYTGSIKVMTLSLKQDSKKGIYFMN